MAFDNIDRKLLDLLQEDADLSLGDLAQKVGSSKTPVWNRLRKLRNAGIIRKQVVLVDPQQIGLAACFFVLIRTNRHDREWASQFITVLRERPEVVEAHRLAGDVDYILKVQVEDARAYDRFYQSLISEVAVYNVTALLSMEEIKFDTALPLPASFAKGAT